MKNFLSFIFSLLLFVNYSFAEVAVQDPDLNLSIEKLRKKYPIGWLEEKYGNAILCINPEEYDRDNNWEKIQRYSKLVDKKNFACAFDFKKNKSVKSYSSDSEDNVYYIESIDYFSVAQIKSAFLNAKKNFVGWPAGLDNKKYVQVRDYRELSIIKLSCEYFLGSEIANIPDEYKKVISFISSQKILNDVRPFVSESVVSCLNDLAK